MVINTPDNAFKALIKESGLPLLKFAEATETSPFEVLRWWSGSKEFFLTDKQIQKFESFFAIPTDSVLSGNANIPLLRKRILGDYYSLPQKYEEGANSYVRSSYYIIQYLNLLYGRHYTDKLLTSMEIHPSYFDNLDNQINIRFITDLLNLCQALGFKHGEFNNLARSLFMSVENTNIENLFQGVASYEEFYHQFYLSTSYFDKNFSYNFIIGKSGAEIICRPNEHLQGQISGKELSILLYYRPLIFSQAPKICDLESLPLEVKSCISLGDTLCRYRVDFPSSRLKLL